MYRLSGIVFIISFFWTRYCQAALGGLEETSDKIGFNKDSLMTMIARLMKWSFGFFGIIFLALMLAGGIRWMTAQGDEKKVENAKQMLTAGVIGLLIVLASFAVTAFLGDSFGPQ